MNVRNCRVCGRIFNYVAGPGICQKCREESEAKFQDVKKFIQDQLNEAAAAKKDALGMKEEYDARLAKVEDESAELLAEARQKAKTRANEIVNEAGDEAHRIVARAEREVALEKDKVRDEMKQEMVQVASLMAGKFVSNSMDEATQAGLIDETLKEMGEETWQN